MSMVKFFALGGLGETGKNMYCLEINNKIFVFDCGSSLPTAQIMGYDAIIPDIQYLIDNKDRIVGIFMSRPSFETTGGFSRIIKDLKVPFYCSEFCLEAMKLRYFPKLDQEDLEELEVKIIAPGNVYEFDDVKLECFILGHNIPDNYAYAIKVNVSTEGEEPVYKNIVYTPDFDFDQNSRGHFRTDFKTITKIADEGVLCLLSASTGASKLGHITTDGKLDLALRKIMAHEGRTFCLMDAENIHGMIKVIQAVKYQNRNVTIIGAKARTVIELCAKLGYCDLSTNYLEKQKLNDLYRNSPNSVIIIAGDQVEEYFKMQEISTFRDPHFMLKKEDNVVFLLETPKKYEKILAQTWNNIAFDNANLIDFDSKLMPKAMCGAEDLKLLYSLLSPDYVIPICGDYKNIKAQLKLLKEFGFEEDNIIELENGMFAEFENGNLIKTTDRIETGDILFGGSEDADINDYVVREREALTREGFIVISGMVSLKERKIYGDIEIVSSGFLPQYGQEAEFKKIKDEFRVIVNEALSQRKVDYKELRLELKNELSKLIQKDTKKRPTLIPVIIDISV